MDVKEAKSFGSIKEHALWGPNSQILATPAQSFLELMYRSNRSFNIPPGHTPGIWHLCRPGKEGIWLSESSRGVGNLILIVRGGEIEMHPRFHVKSLAWRAVMLGGRGVRGFSWKRLRLYGQLMRRKGLKKALCRIWRYLSFKSCLQWNTIPIPAIRYNNKKLNRGQLLWPAACMLIYVPVKCRQGGGIWSPEWTLVWGIWTAFWPG